MAHLNFISDGNDPVPPSLMVIRKSTSSTFAVGRFRLSAMGYKVPLHRWESVPRHLLISLFIFIFQFRYLGKSLTVWKTPMALCVRSCCRWMFRGQVTYVAVALFYSILFYLAHERNHTFRTKKTFLKKTFSRMISHSHSSPPPPFNIVLDAAVSKITLWAP